MDQGHPGKAIPMSFDAYRHAVSPLTQSYDLLAPDHPVLAQQVLDQLVATIPPLLPALTPREKSATLFHLPDQVLCTLLENPTASPFHFLYTSAVPGIPLLDFVPKSVVALSVPALTHLKDLGFAYNRLIDLNTARDLWLTKGPVFGEVAWRKAHPRLNPVLSRWQEQGLTLPKSPLCEEGIALVAETIRSFSPTHITVKLFNTIRTYGAHWRVLLCFLLENKGPEYLSERRFWKHNLCHESPLYDEFLFLFKTHDSAHRMMEQQEYLAFKPSLETILRLPAYPEPKSILPLFKVHAHA
jgi:hypothetical protein